MGVMCTYTDLFVCISDSMKLWLCNYVVRSFDFKIYRLESYNNSLQFILFLINNK